MVFYFYPIGDGHGHYVQSVRMCGKVLVFLVYTEYLLKNVLSCSFV